MSCTKFFYPGQPRCYFSLVPHGRDTAYIYACIMAVRSMCWRPAKFSASAPIMNETRSPRFKTDHTQHILPIRNGDVIWRTRSLALWNDMLHSDQIAFDVMHYNIITWFGGDLMQSICTLMGVRHSQLGRVCKCQDSNRDCVILNYVQRPRAVS